MLTLPSCPNFRNFGGYRKKNGELTKSAPVYRSDSLARLTPREVAAVEEAGVTCVVDLRYAKETAEAPNPFLARPAARYHNISLKDGLLRGGDLGAYLNAGLCAFYISLVEEAGSKIAEVFSVIAQNLGGVVFHCTAGKDRTGVIAALFLLLNGVSEDEVVSDYAKTYALLRDYLENDKKQLEAKGVRYADHVFLSEPETMRRFIAHIENTHKTAENYLRRAGLSEAAIKALKNAL